MELTKKSYNELFLNILESMLITPWRGYRYFYNAVFIENNFFKKSIFGLVATDTTYTAKFLY